MCRWAAWAGAPIYLEDIICRPGHSLICQSRKASEAKTEINADGFGVAWYGDRAEPGLYRDVYPAWSDPNLASLARLVKSPIFLAHVRASTGTATSRNNCHPFTHGRWSFMHNGQAGGFEQFRQRADMAISEALYATRKGATDSEVLFLLALNFGLDDDPKGAMEQAVAALEAMSRARGTTPYMRATAAFSDGETLYALRYASDAHAPSLYHRWSEQLNGRAVVSEPLEDDQAGWCSIPAGSFAVFKGRDVEITPFSPQVASYGQVA